MSNRWYFDRDQNHEKQKKKHQQITKQSPRNTTKASKSIKKDKNSTQRVKKIKKATQIKTRKGHPISPDIRPEGV